jgi:hypothetical protein
MSTARVGRKARAKYYFGTTRRRCRLACLETLSLRMHDEKERGKRSLARSPAHRHTFAAFLVAGSASVGSCTLDLRQALAGWRAGKTDRGRGSPLSLSLRTKRRRRTTGADQRTNLVEKQLA